MLSQLVKVSTGSGWFDEGSFLVSDGDPVVGILRAMAVVCRVSFCQPTWRFLDLTPAADLLL